MRSAPGRPHRLRVAPPDPLRRIAEVVVPRAVEAIDVNGLLAEVDVDRLLERVDVDALLGRVDVERLMDRVDIAAVVRRAQVDALVSATAGGLGNRLLDLLRR